MIEITEEIETDVPPEAAFDYIADPHNHLEFTSSLMDVRNVEDAEVGKRGEYTFKMVGTSLDGSFEDTAFDRPNRRAYELRGGLEGTITWIVEATDGGSRIRYEATTDLPGPDLLDAITDRIARRFLEKEAETTVENLKVLLDERQVEA